MKLLMLLFVLVVCLMVMKAYVVPFFRKKGEADAHKRDEMVKDYEPELGDMDVKNEDIH